MSAPRWLNRLCLLGLCALGLAAVRPAFAEEAPFVETDLRTLARASRNLARAMEGDLATELLDAVVALGYPEDKAGRLRAECERLAARASPRSVARQRDVAARSIRKEVARLAGALASLSKDRKARAAGVLVKLDASCDALQVALGRERIDGAWITPEEKRLLPRRREFQQVLQNVRASGIDVTHGTSTDPMLAEVLGRAGNRVVAGRTEIQGALPTERLARILRESLRASMVARWLITGELKPFNPRPSTFTVFRSEERYVRALDVQVRLGLITRQERDSKARLSSTHRYVGERVHVTIHKHTEASIEGVLLRYFTNVFMCTPDDTLLDVQPSLRAALLNLVGLAYIGLPMAGITWDSKEGEYDRRSTVETAKSRLVRHYPRAGLRGNQRYMAWLVKEGKAPPWIRTFRDKIGMIEGDELIKTTCMLQFLAEHRPLRSLFAAMCQPVKGEQPIALLLEKALAEPLGRLEERWLAWLLPETGVSLLGRLTDDGSSDASLSSEVVAVLAYLNRMRRHATLEDVLFDAGLAEDAGRHAEYLSKNPEQLAAWPDAHEEYPDKPGFSPEGCWAGLHSVISPGDDPVPEAIDGWFGTFYHRLPLLDPGLLAVGWGSSAGAVVLDSGSLSMRTRFEVEVLWPYRGMKDVPTRFVPELPNPVPGEDQSRWGYPITLQKWTEGGGEAGGVTMVLHEGKRGGPVVPSHFSTPDRPTNPEHAPSNAYCLIPRSHLKPGARYVVVARFTEPAGELVWAFTTAR